MHLRYRAVLTVLFGLLAHSGVCAKARPNILFLLADDQREGTLSIDGHPVIKTPNLDRLAGEGLNGREVKHFFTPFGRTVARVFRTQRLGISLFQPPLAFQLLFERKIPTEACGKSVALPAMAYR
ncbi:hypothetical protein SCARR_01448 [Pontiella sulfatireligans]|uniref:Uncharacterized protein n=1 Tax=Pontiella sulfatireligans TaxID=2750658 RepID=A0A6C2UGT0_9BACT|nr:hypothetical protein SCARR_01448 [Pontiella sulfatireligans]